MLVFIALASMAWAQQASVSGDWAAMSTWGGAVPTSASGVVSITSSVQIVVNAPVNLATTTALTLGALGTTGTQLIVNGTSFTVLTLNWANGWIVGQAGGSVKVVGLATLSGGAGVQDRQLVGGTFSLMPPLGAVSITGGSLCVNGSTLDSQGASWKISSGAWLNFSANSVSAVNSTATFQGSGSAAGSVSIQGELQNSATLNIGNAGALGVGVSPSNTWVSGNFTLTGDGQANVNAGSSLIVAAGGRLKRASANAAAQINVAASATLEFAAGTTSWLDASISSSGNIVVDAGATTTVSASSTISGSGSLNISGTLIANAGLNLGSGTAYQTTVYSGGDLQIGAGVAATLGQTTFKSGSHWHLAFSGSSFQQVTVSGTLALDGMLHLDVPQNPAGKVTLVTATSITGFASANVMITSGVSAGRRLLASGSVAQDGNSLTYTPANGSSALKAGIGALALPLLALLW